MGGGGGVGCIGQQLLNNQQQVIVHMNTTSQACCCGVSAKCSEMFFQKKQSGTRTKNLDAAASQVQNIHTDHLYEKKQHADDVSFH